MEPQTAVKKGFLAALGSRGINSSNLEMINLIINPSLVLNNLVLLEENQLVLSEYNKLVWSEANKLVLLEEN